MTLFHFEEYFPKLFFIPKFLKVTCNVEAKEREKSHRSDEEAFLMGGTGTGSHVASVADHSSDPSEEIQERITDILGHRSTPERLPTVFIHFKRNVYFQVKTTNKPPCK